MVESLKELNEICQKPRYKEVGNWMVRKILRPAALPITWLLLHTGITANQVTLIAIGTGLFGIYLLSQAGTGMFIAGCLFLQLWYLLDHVDGQVARYRKTVSLTGRFYDFVMHHLIHGVLFWGLANYAFAQTGRLFFLGWGFWLCIAIIFFNMIHDVQYKTFFEYLIKFKTYRSRIEEPKEEDAAPAPESSNPLKKIFSFLHKSAEIHVVMNVLTAAALFQFVVKAWPIDNRMLAFAFYGITIPVITVVRYAYFIQKRKADEAFESAFEETRN